MRTWILRRSRNAAELLTQEFPGGPPNLVLIAEAGTGTVDSPAAVESGRELTEQLAETPGVGGVHSYWASPDLSLRADGGRSALIALQLTGGEHAAHDTAARIIDDLEETATALRVSATGAAAVGLAVDEQAESDLVSAEMVTLPIASPYSVPSHASKLVRTQTSASSSRRPQEPQHSGSFASSS